MATPRDRLRRGASTETEDDDAGKISKAFPTLPQGEILELLREIAGHVGPEETQPTRFLPVVPQDGRQLIPSGGTREFQTSNIPEVAGFIIDVPTEMDAVMTRDGNPLLTVEDGQGRSGTFEFPGRLTANWETVEFVVENNASVAQDCSLWIVGVY